jgi:hypothetical protein
VGCAVFPLTFEGEPPGNSWFALIAFVVLVLGPATHGRGIVSLVLALARFASTDGRRLAGALGGARHLRVAHRAPN